VEFHNFVIDIEADVAIQQLVSLIYISNKLLYNCISLNLLNIFLAIKFNVTYILRQLLIIMSYVWVQDHVHYTIIPSPVASIPLVRNQVSCTALPGLVHFLLYMQGQFK